MKNFKKLVALGMTAVMLMGNMTAFAAEGDQDDPEVISVSGNGTESYVDKEVFKINVPTNAATAFNFAVDPGRLVNETKGAEFGLTSEVTDEGVFFKNMNATDKTKVDKVSNTSDKFTITNKSSVGVTLVVSANLVDGTDDEDSKFTGSFSSTPDFGYTLEAGTQKTADKAAALYFGLRADNEIEKSLSATEKSFNNSILTAYDKYEVKYADGYTFTLKADAKDFPTYSFEMFGQLNFDASDDNWTYVDKNNKTQAKVMPAISVKFTPVPVTGAKKALAFKGDPNTGDLWMSKPNGTEEDGKFDTKPTAIYLNGKAVEASKIQDPNAEANGHWIHISWDDICYAWGYTDPSKVTPEEEAAIWDAVKTIKATVGTESYYAEVSAE
jgi:hypothetical protein